MAELETERVASKAAIVCGPEHGGTRWVFALIQRHPQIRRIIHMSIPSGGKLYNIDEHADNLESDDAISECIIFYVIRDYSCTKSSQNKAHTVSFDMLDRYNTDDSIEMAKKHVKSTSINHRVIYVSYESLLHDRNEYLKQLFTLSGLDHDYPYLTEEDIDIGHSEKISTVGFDANKKYIKPLYDVTVIVPFYNELKLIYTQIVSILKTFAHPYVDVNIIYVNASKDEVVKHKLRKLACIFRNVRVIESEGGIGQSVDSGLSEVKTSWTCIIHADTFPVKDTWLYDSANIYERHDLSFIGHSPIKHDPYARRLSYPMDSYFLFGRTNIFRLIKSKIAGFHKSGNMFLSAHRWCDENIMKNKISLPMTRVFTKSRGKLYGTVINDSIIHLGSFSSLKDKNSQTKIGKLYTQISAKGLDMDGLLKVHSSTFPHKEPAIYYDNVEKETALVRSNVKLYKHVTR